MSPEDTKLKIRVASEQHACDWGTGMASREIRSHSFRFGDEHGYQRAIDDLKQCMEEADTRIETVSLMVCIQTLEDRQKQLNILQGKLP